MKTKGNQARSGKKCHVLAVVRMAWAVLVPTWRATGSVRRCRVISARMAMPIMALNAASPGFRWLADRYPLAAAALPEADGGTGTDSGCLGAGGCGSVGLVGFFR